MGFHMLNNDRIPIVEGRDTLWLVGVENWGNPPFPRYGKLDVAIDSLPGQACIILYPMTRHTGEVKYYKYPG